MQSLQKNYGQINFTQFHSNNPLENDKGLSISEANRALHNAAPQVFNGRLAEERTRSRKYRAKKKAASSAKNVRERLISIKRTSSCTWDTIAELLGISTRTLHLWRKGGNITEENFMRLNALDETLCFIDPGSGLRMKGLFATINREKNQTIHEMLINKDFESVRAFVGEGPGRKQTLPLTPEEDALFTPLSVPVLINQRRLDFYPS
jgi:hypothetical protein